MLCTMTRDRFERFLKQSFKGQSVRTYYYTWGVEVYINGLYASYKDLKNRIGIDIRDIKFVDANLSNLDMWKDFLKKGEGMVWFSVSVVIMVACVVLFFTSVD